MRQILPFRNFLFLLPVAVIGCGQSQDNFASENAGNASFGEPAQIQAHEQPNPPSNPAKGSASYDPASAAAAQAVLIDYARHLESGQLSEARRSWTEGSDSSIIDGQLEQFDRIKAEVGNPGRMEGAAGSSYIEIPLDLTGLTRNGKPLALSGTAILRRVNDVPGSTELQRRWHIYRVELQPGS